MTAKRNPLGDGGHPLPTDSAVRLRVTDVDKSYGDDESSKLAVKGVSFDVRAGEFVSLVGPSGCGKSTMLKACAGLLPITSGTIDYDGTGGPALPGRYGMVFQTSTLLPWWTVLQNVLLPARVLHLEMKPATRRARELLELVGLGGTEDKYPGELSGGMQQRASLARALLHEPDLVFMDEPFGALDAITRDSMNTLLQQIARELRQTILFVTHSIQEAVWLSDRVLVMSSGPGRIIEDVEVDFPRPRNLALLANERFRTLEVQLKEELNATLMSDSGRGRP
ncbi:MAG: ABC transporter ATP-binding protein [Mycobacteriales bacterium]